jgi:hypothetical protein
MVADIHTGGCNHRKSKARLFITPQTCMPVSMKSRSTRTHIRVSNIWLMVVPMNETFWLKMRSLPRRTSIRSTLAFSLTVPTRTRNRSVKSC